MNTRLTYAYPSDMVATPTYPSLLDTLSKRGIGFNSQFSFFDELLKATNNTKFPPYDILSTDEDKYEIRFAVAGFSKDEIEVTFDKNVLIVKGNKEDEDTDAYFHKGIAARNFTQSFPLAEYVDVVGADLKDGILTIKLERELPEELKPRVIKIK